MTWAPLAQPRLPTLEAGRVHLVHLPLAHAAVASARVEPLLAPAERERARRYAFARDRDRYVLTRGTLRELLGSALAREPASLRLVEGPYGKPALHPEDAAGVHFNLSHSGEHALLAFARGRELGVDLEQARAQVDVRGVAALVFSADEQRALWALPEPLHRSAFFQLWARKEALIKAEGTGFAEPSAAFTLSVDPHAPPRLIAHTTRPEALGRWTLCDLDLGALELPGYAAALACEGGLPDMALARLSAT